MTTAALTKVSPVTIAGWSGRCSGWSAGHLQSTIARLAVAHPKARLRIIQGTFSNGKYSAGTHDKDCVFDVEIIGLGWWDAQKFLRSCGWAAWFRHTGTWAAESAWHIHMVSIAPGLSNTPTLAQVVAAYDELGVEIGDLVAAQVYDYFRHALGLKGEHDAGDDHSDFPPDIAATIYDPEEDFVGYSSWDPKDKKALLDDIANAVWGRMVPTNDAPKGRTIQNLMRKVYDALVGK